MADSEKQTPVKQSLCGSLRSGGHWKCLALTLMIVGCLAAIFWCNLTITNKTSTTFLNVPVRSERSGPCKDGYVYIPVACLVMLYLVYLVECWHSHTRLELRYKCDIATVYQAVNKMQAALPVIWWKATCYHYVRRTRQVMRYRNGDAFTSTQVYYERVDSSTAGAAFNFTQCGVKDISRPLSDLEQYTAVKIKVSKGFSFANMDTEFRFEEQRARFFQEHETKDDYMEGREGMDLTNVDFKEYMVAFRDPQNLPWYVSPLVFWVASACLMSWPLRTIIELQTAHLHYHVHKLFGASFLDEDGQTGVMSRVSTMNSTEFEMSIRNNNVIVPSYSEAMLADDLEQSQQRHYGTIKVNPVKLPRSLTNVALSSRPSSAAKRSSTPTVTMNHVKKFKSCSTFGTSEPSDSSCYSGSVRQQIQMLLRDRGRLQSKRAAISQCSISGLLLSNGSARFQVGTPGTPEDFPMTGSFSCNSVSSSKTTEPLSEGDVVNAVASSLTRTTTESQRTGNIKLSHHISIQTSSGNGEASRTPEHNEDCTPVAEQGTSSTCEITTAAHDDAEFCYNIPVSQISSDCPGEPTALVSRESPSPPPIYEQAITMQRLAPAAETQVSAPANLPSEVDPPDATPRQERKAAPTLRKAIRAEPRKSRRDHRNNATRSKTSTGKRPPADASSSSSTRKPNPGVQSPQPPEGKGSQKQQQCSHLPNPSHHHQHLSGRPVLKVLPKISPKMCDDSLDSDVECLHKASLDCFPSFPPERINNARPERLHSALPERLHSAPQECLHSVIQEGLNNAPQERLHSAPQERLNSAPPERLHNASSDRLNGAPLHNSPPETFNNLPSARLHRSPLALLISSQSESLHIACSENLQSAFTSERLQTVASEYTDSAPSELVHSDSLERLQSSISGQESHKAHKPPLKCSPKSPLRARSASDGSILRSAATSSDPEVARDHSSDPDVTPDPSPDPRIFPDSGANTSRPSGGDSTAQPEPVPTTSSPTCHEGQHETSV